MHKRALLFILFLVPAFFSRAQTVINDSSFFTPASFYQSLGFTQTESNKALKVYTKKLDEPGDISRTVDIRWVFATKQEAQTYLEKNLELQSEGGYKYQKEITLPNADKLYVYREDPSAAGMYAMMGIENVHWYYIFVIDRVVAKIFTSGNRTSIGRSYQLALEAARHISAKLGLPENKRSISKFDFPFEKGFKEKIENGKLDFYPLPGFEPAPLPKGLDEYFDQEYKLPGDKFNVRYYIVTNPGQQHYDLTDSVAHKKYCKEKKLASLSVSLNIMMGSPGTSPGSNENKDQADCKKINNSDFIVEYFFEVGEGSQLAKGYKYCYMYATYKQDAPDCYVVFLFDDVKKIDLFGHMNKSSIRYRD